MELKAKDVAVLDGRWGIGWCGEKWVGIDGHSRRVLIVGMVPTPLHLQGGPLSHSAKQCYFSERKLKLE